MRPCLDPDKRVDAPAASDPVTDFGSVQSIEYFEHLIPKHPVRLCAWGSEQHDLTQSPLSRHSNSGRWRAGLVEKTDLAEPAVLVRERLVDERNRPAQQTPVLALSPPCSLRLDTF